MPPLKKLSISFEPKNASDLAAFFSSHKDEFHEIWVVLTKKSYANPQPISFMDAVAEALKQGLVDSRTKTISPEKYEIRFTKRKILLEDP